jgi:ESS family glutamate:Na+ symporter
MTLITLAPVETLTLSILVLYVGMYLNAKVSLLGDNNIPAAVTGGILFSCMTALAYQFTDIRLSFDMQIRDILLLVFFSTIGLAAKFKVLVHGGKALALLVGISFVCIVLQDVIGIAIAMAFGHHPAYGLVAGSIAFTGGHGTAIAWGNVADEAGLHAARELGIAFATFGLIAGGLVGGPIAKWLIKTHRLQGPGDIQQSAEAPTATQQLAQLSAAGQLRTILGVLLVLALCVQIGRSANTLLGTHGLLLPSFLMAMLAGILLTNLADLGKVSLHPITVSKFGEVALNLFLSMSLMSMEFSSLANVIAPVTLVLVVQTFVMVLFAVFVVFRVMGRDYDAAVIASGFAGLGLGATPVAIANMDAITLRYGPSLKAFLIVPLVGAFFIDLLNAATIKTFISIIKAWLV